MVVNQSSELRLETKECTSKESLCNILGDCYSATAYYTERKGLTI